MSKRNYGIYVDGKPVPDGFDLVPADAPAVEYQGESVMWLRPMSIWRRLFKAIGADYGRR